MLPLVSIIIPVYNTSNYLNTCLSSVMKQKYENLEVILVDDGSTDESYDICKKATEKDARFHIYKKENGGLSDARNFALDRVHGEYVFFLDSDDYIPDYCIDTMVKNSLDNNTDIVCGSYERFNNNGKHYGARICSVNKVLVKKEAMKEMISENNISTMACNKLYRSRLFMEIRFPYRKLHEDIFVMHKIFDLVDKVSIIKDITYYYRENPSSITKSSFTPQKQDAVDAEKKRYDFITANYPELSDIQLQFYVWHCVSINYMILKSGIKTNNRNIYKSNISVIKNNISFFIKSKASIKSKVMSILLLIANLFI